MMSRRMDKDRSHVTERILNLTVEVIQLLTGKDHTVVRKTSGKCETPSSHLCVSGGLSRTQSPITVPPPRSLTHERHSDQKILKLTNKIIQLLTGEVPIRCEDVTVYLSMEEWEYIEEHRGLYKDVMMENHQALKMDMTERIINLFLDIICVLTGEDHTVVKGTSGECEPPSSHHRVSGGLSRTQSPITVPPPHSLIHEKHNDQKILDLTNKIIQLLTGEVPIRCEDVTVSFSMEEWEYIEEHRGLYKDVMMENHRPLTSLDGASNRNTPERCPRPLYPQDSTEESPSVLQEGQGEDLNESKIDDTEEETYVGDQLCNEEEIPTGIGTEFGPYSRTTPEEHLFLSPDCEKEHNDITQDSPGEIPNKPLRTEPSSDPSNHEKCPPDELGDVAHCTALRDDAILPCLECGKCFSQNTECTLHQRTARSRKPLLCSERGKSFTQMSKLITNTISHSEKKQFTCSECGKCFTKKSDFVTHQVIHTGDEPFPCSECEKCFTQKTDLIKHWRVHTAGKPIICSECGKCFTRTSDFVRHQWIHTGQRPFPCPACGKRFAYKTVLVNHQRTHTGEKPFPCSKCGKCFTQRTHLVTHQRTHTGEKPYLCSECGECFSYKLALVKHQRSHAG